MKKIFFAMAALAALSFAGCQKDGTDPGKNPDPIEQGKDTSMGLKLTMHASATRADEPTTVVGTEDESTFDKIDVFIFETNGQLCTAPGSVQELGISDFTVDAGGMTYTLNDAKAIKTLSGNKHIYVVANPTADVAAATTETALLAAVTAGNVATMSTAGAFTMVSPMVLIDLQPANPGDAATGDEDTVITGGTTNLVTTDLERVVAKVTASSSAADYTNTWDATIAPNVALQLHFTIQDFRPIQRAITSYVFANTFSNGNVKTYPGVAPTAIANATAAVDPFNAFSTDAAAAAYDIVTPHPADADLTNMVGAYVGENNPVDANSQPMALKLNTTYIDVATTATANMAAKWVDANTDEDNAVTAGDGHVEWEDLTATPYGHTDPANVAGTDNSDIYVIWAPDGHQYVTNEANANDLAIGLGVDPNPANNPANVGMFVYTAGWVHFPVYLNHVGQNDYAVLRNEFIHIKLNSVLNNNYTFPGNPGDPANPDQPIPQDAPQNPVPVTPDEPVDPQNAFLDLQVDVLPWNYKASEITLGDPTPLQ